MSLLHNSGIIAIILVLLAVVGIYGCSADRTIGPLGPRPIDFELEIPNTIPAADFYAVSGLSAVIQKVQVGDSLIDALSPSFYAQFTADTGVSLPAAVQINGVSLDRHLETDTLRLAGGALGVDLSGLHTWTIADSGEAAEKFQIGGVVPIDSISPFPTKQPVRGDTALRITWQPSGDASVRMMLVWRVKGSNNPYIQSLSDNSGAFVVPREVMLTLTGQGTVHLIRYRYISQSFRNRSLVLVRTAQRTFDVTVLQ